MSEELIRETIEFGNIFEAIELNIFEYQVFIDYLAKNADKMKIESLRLCYNALLRYYPPTYHYSYGKHLLTYFPKDDFIYRFYLLLNGSPELPVNKDDPSNTLWSILFDHYSELVNDSWSEEIEVASLLCNKITSNIAKKILVSKEKDFIEKLFEYRCEKIIALLPICGIASKETRHLYIEKDWFECYPSIHSNTWYNKYIVRANFLRLNAPDYFSKMSFCFQKCLEQFTLTDFEKLNIDLLKMTSLCFPAQFSSLDVSDTYIRLNIYPLIVRAYILGLSCFPRVPSKQEIDDAVSKLEKIGIDSYVETVLKSDSYPEEKIANTEDTLFEKPDLYVEFDRFDIFENGKIYRFTRPEFKKLYQDKVNFWTKTKISLSDLHSIHLRILMSTNMCLPQSDTLKNLLEKACKGILFQELNEGPQTPPPNQQNTNPIPNNQAEILIQLFHNMMNQGQVVTPVIAENTSVQNDNDEEVLSEGEVVIE